MYLYYLPAFKTAKTVRCMDRKTSEVLAGSVKHSQNSNDRKIEHNVTTASVRTCCKHRSLSYYNLNTPSLNQTAKCRPDFRSCDQDINIERLPKQKGNFQSNSLVGGHKSIYDIVIFQNTPFTELVSKLKHGNFLIFRIAKFSICTVSR